MKGRYQMGEEFFKPFIIVQELEAFVRKHHFKNELIRFLGIFNYIDPNILSFFSFNNPPSIFYVQNVKI